MDNNPKRDRVLKDMAEKEYAASLQGSATTQGLGNFNQVQELQLDIQQAHSRIKSLEDELLQLYRKLYTMGGCY